MNGAAAARPAPQPRPVLLVGDLDHGDFAEPIRWLEANTRCRSRESLEQGLAELREGFVPAAIVAAQSRPGLFPLSQLELLHVASPLSRLVVLLGSWCEGELRSGRPWSGAIRVLWHQWQPQLMVGLTADAPASAGWSLPRTASQAERLAAAAELPWLKGEGLVAVQTATREMYAALSDALQAAGYAAVWMPRGAWTEAAGIAAALWDGVRCDESEAAEIAAFADRCRPAPVVALLDYVRRQDLDRARRAGAAAVLVKPLQLFDLMWHLRRARHAGEGLLKGLPPAG